MHVVNGLTVLEPPPAAWLYNVRELNSLPCVFVPINTHRTVSWLLDQYAPDT